MDLKKPLAAATLDNRGVRYYSPWQNPCQGGRNGPREVIHAENTRDTQADLGPEYEQTIMVLRIKTKMNRNLRCISLQ